MKKLITTYIILLIFFLTWPIILWMFFKNNYVYITGLIWYGLLVFNGIMVLFIWRLNQCQK